MESDEEVARLILEEARRRRERAATAGVLAYRENSPLASSGPGDVNKRYLGSLVTAVVGHNRRNQEDQCWRAKALDNANASGTVEVGEKRRRSPSPRNLASSGGTTGAAVPVQELSREVWAQRKAAFMRAAEDIPLQDNTSGDAKKHRGEGRRDKHGKSAKKERKKDKKKSKKHMKEKKKAKKRKKKDKRKGHERSASSDGSSSGENSTGSE